MSYQFLDELNKGNNIFDQNMTNNISCTGAVNAEVFSARDPLEVVFAGEGWTAHVLGALGFASIFIFLMVTVVSLELNCVVGKRFDP